jgi:hypothetical protein
MFRLGLIAYLSLATVFGPFLCCCSVPRLTGLFGSDSRYANKAAGRNEISGNRVGRASCCNSQSSKPGTAKPESAPPANDGDRSNCPCGKHQPTVVATDVSQSQSKIVDVSEPLWDLPVANLSSLFDFDFVPQLDIVHEKPAGIYGRKMLRAFQIMRC